MKIKTTINPEKIENTLSITPRNKYVIQVIKKLSGGRKITQLNKIGIALKGPTPPENLIDISERSGQNQYNNPIGKFLKRKFLKMQYHWSYQKFIKNPQSLVFVWNGQKGYRKIACAAAEAAGQNMVYLERAPLPGRLSIDFHGVNAGSSLPKTPDFFQLWQSKNTNIDQEKWREITPKLTSRKADKRQDIQQKPAGSNLTHKPYVFVPLQVPGDSQITVFGDWIHSMEDFIDKICIAEKFLPENWHFRIKEHPSSRISLKKYIERKCASRIVIDNETDTLEQVSFAQAILTLNSSVGFEAIFFDKPVLTLGESFYDVPGVAKRATTLDQLTTFLKSPESIEFDSVIRNAFMNYVTEVHFPMESDVLNGYYRIEDVYRRDSAMFDIMEMLKLRRAGSLTN